MKISFDSDKDCSTLLQECRIKLHDNYTLFTPLPMVYLIGSPTFIKKKKKNDSSNAQNRNVRVSTQGNCFWAENPEVEKYKIPYFSIKYHRNSTR